LILYFPTCGGRKSAKSRLTTEASEALQVEFCSTCGRRKSTKNTKINVTKTEESQIDQKEWNRLAAAASPNS